MIVQIMVSITSCFCIIRNSFTVSYQSDYVREYLSVIVLMKI